MAMEKVREYPQCAGLQHSVAMVLEGGLLMADLSDEDRDRCQTQITGLYERVAQSDDLILSNSARYMLASKSIQRGDYDKAQELLDQIPKKGIPDKRTLQADLLAKQGKTTEAEAVLERMTLNSLQETLMYVTKLIPLLAADGNVAQAKQLADASRAECEAFGLWQYSASLAQMLLAVSSRDVQESIRLISAMLRAAETPWDISTCPLFCHQPRKENSENMGQTFLPPLLADLERNPEYAFLQGEPDSSNSYKNISKGQTGLTSHKAGQRICPALCMLPANGTSEHRDEDVYNSYTLPIIGRVLPSQHLA